jgi:hypothetical protein
MLQVKKIGVKMKMKEEEYVTGEEEKGERKNMLQVKKIGVKMKMKEEEYVTGEEENERGRICYR